MWLLGFISTSLGFLIGGSFAWIFKGLQGKIDTIYAVCAGLILGLISIEIFPEAIDLGGWFISMMGLIVGGITFYFIHNLLHHNYQLKSISKKNMYIRTGLILMLSLSIHNIPMGIMLGASQKDGFTITILQSLLFHSIPEGIILFTPLIVAGINMFIWLLISLIVSVPVAFGVYIGDFIGVKHEITSAILISVTVGIMLLVTITEILFPSLKKSPTLRIVFYTLIGIGVMGLYLKIV